MEERALAKIKVLNEEITWLEMMVRGVDVTIKEGDGQKWADRFGKIQSDMFYGDRLKKAKEELVAEKEDLKYILFYNIMGYDRSQGTEVEENYDTQIIEMLEQAISDYVDNL